MKFEFRLPIEQQELGVSLADFHYSVENVQPGMLTKYEATVVAQQNGDSQSVSASSSSS